MKKTITLVLGSGGARGYAHIGVIEALRDAGFQIEAIVGASMGALIGGLYANRTLDEYKEWVLTLDFLDVLSLADFTLSEAGMIKGDRVFDKMAYMLGDTAIEDLPIGFTAVATDLTHRREVWFQRGSLKKAIRASIAIPMVFTPLREGNRILADGGILNPLPVAAAAAYPADLVAAVNVNAFNSQNYPLPPPQVEQDKQDAFRNGLAQFLKSVGWKDASEKMQPEMGLFETLQRSFEIMQASVSNYKIAGYPPDIIIEIPADACNAYDFHKAYDMIEVGRKAARQVLRQKGMLD